MGWRFRRSVSILPGVRLNFSNAGISTSIGPRGASIYFSSRGKRANVGIPGTGLSYSSPLPQSTYDPGTDYVDPPSGSGSRAPAFIGASVLSFLVGMCAMGSLQPPDGNSAAPQSLMSTSSPSDANAGLDAGPDNYVSARRANARSRPTQSSSIVTVLGRGDRVRVVGRDGEWSKVFRAGMTFWVLSSLLADARPVAKAAKSVKPAKSHMARAKRSAPRRSASHSRSYSASGSCPCGSGNICIGPRGGRYCITSGGNKRYGM